MKVKFLKLFVVLFFATLFVGPSFCETKTYSGKVLDSKTKGPLAFATVSRIGVTSEGTTTDVDGEFSTKFSDNKITFSYTGCQQVTKEMTTDYTTVLLDCSVRLDEVEISFQKICESEQNKGTFDATNNKCICPEGRQWNDARNECVVSSVPTLPSRGLTESKMPDKLEPRQTVATDKEFCESTENEGQWNEKKKTCKCPEKKVWIVGNKKCEDADLEAMRQACWKLVQKGKTLWDEETNSCTCIKTDETADESKKYEYDSRRKIGKCVDVKEEKKPETQPEQPKPKERSPEEMAAALDEKRAAYEEAEANEQSKANKLLTAGTTAAMGIGAMELAQGLAEQKADKNAQQNMDAYIATMRCTYGDGKSVKAGPNEVELPGGNDSTIMQYRNEYIALAADLKQRKESLNMKPGIESEVIYDKATMGLYDDENVGISGGQYASLYRATMLESEADQAKIKEEQETSATRVKGGAIALGAGAVVGIAGNSLINGKLGEKIKEIKENINYKNNEETALKDLKQCLKDAGATNVNKLKFDKFTPSVLNLDNIDCKNDLTDIAGKDATTLLTDSDDAAIVSEKLTESFGEKNAKAMLGDGDFGQGLKYCGNSVEGNHFPVRTSSATSWNKCDELAKGEWRVEFADDKYLEGISVCSYSAGENIESVFVGNSVPDSDLQAKIQKDYDNWVSDGKPDFPKPEGSPSEIGCYCKTSDGAKWVYNYASTFSGCKTNCAWDCGSKQTTTKQVGNIDFTNTLVTGVHTVYQ